MSERLKRLRCAIYTRKSTEEGLEQDFNSLHAQREACEAYIRSQKHEGWVLVATPYDDGGYSGGSMDRPALQALLSGIRNRSIDVVVVYKVDRLTRSLMDFAKIVEVFDAQGVSFVSVTQAFNTTTSMGRLTLNVLLSFAQFEREVTGERIRDKIAASKKKGLWMGGPVPLGYAVRQRKLVVVEAEAALVRDIFQRYAELRSVRLLKNELDQDNTRSPRRTLPTGRVAGGDLFSRGKLYGLLQNPILIGQIQHRGITYPGEQRAIIDQALWDQVQTILADNRQDRKQGKNAAHPSLLTGLLFDETGARFTPSHAIKQGKRYRYYISQALVEGRSAAEGWRLPAENLENAVIARLCGFLTSPTQLIETLALNDKTADELTTLFATAERPAKTLKIGSATEKRTMLQTLLRRITVAADQLSIGLNPDGLNEMLGLQSTDGDDDFVPTLRARLNIRKRGVETKLIIADASEPLPAHDPVLIQTVAKAFVWMEMLKQDSCISLRTLARREGVDISMMSRSLPLAFLAPDIVEAIVDGRQPAEFTAKALMRIEQFPISWAEQRRAL